MLSRTLPGADEDAPAPFEPLAERTSARPSAGERESERAAEHEQQQAAARPPTTRRCSTAAERDDWENGTERDDFDGIGETPSKSAAQGEGERFRRRRARRRLPTLQSICASSCAACACPPRTPPR